MVRLPRAREIERFTQRYPTLALVLGLLLAVFVAPPLSIGVWVTVLEWLAKR